MDENDRYVNEIKVRPENDQESVQPIEIKVGDVRFTVAYTENVEIIEVRVMQIRLNDSSHQSEITVQRTDKPHHIWFLDLIKFLEWSNFKTYEEAETALEEWRDKNERP